MDTKRYWTENDSYHRRQGDVGSVRSNVALFTKILLGCSDNISSILEFGAGTGMNIEAIGRLYPEIESIAVELNETASKEIPADYVFRMSIQEYSLNAHKHADLVFTKGLLIHLHPADLPVAYDTLYQTSNRYILVCEYYNPRPVEVEYRGHDGLLFKRDFAGELMSQHPDLELVDYGFVYHRDQYPQDDLHWFLMEKTDV